MPAPPVRGMGLKGGTSTKAARVARLVLVRPRVTPSGVAGGGERMGRVVEGCRAHCWVLREQPVTRRLSWWGVVVSGVSGCRYPSPLLHVSGRSSFGMGVWCGVVVGVVGAGAHAWLLFVNCTVDASIFSLCHLVGSVSLLGVAVRVVKFVKAQGGCLGTKSRRKTSEPAISLGELATKR